MAICVDTNFTSWDETRELRALNLASHSALLAKERPT